MKIRITTVDRKEFAKLLAERTGLTVEYLGVPTFSYRVGPYTVCRDRTLEVEEDMADEEVLRDFTEREYLDGSWDKDVKMLCISLPMNCHTSQSLINLVRIIASRQELINHAIGYEGFHVGEEFIKALDVKRPDTVEKFAEIMEKQDAAEHAGFSLADGKIRFEGFPHTDDLDKMHAYMQLCTLMNTMAIKQRRVRTEKPDTTNEKYSFRVWLLRLGMVGDDYKKSREVLLSKLSGNSAFRTKEQKDAFYERLKEKRAAAKADEEVSDEEHYT